MFVFPDCPSGTHGLRCSEKCDCGGAPCHPITGKCQCPAGKQPPTCELRKHSIRVKLFQFRICRWCSRITVSSDKSVNLKPVELNMHFMPCIKAFIDQIDIHLQTLTGTLSLNTNKQTKIVNKDVSTTSSCFSACLMTYELRREKTGLQGFRPGLTQRALCSYA